MACIGAGNRRPIVLFSKNTVCEQCAGKIRSRDPQLFRVADDLLATAHVRMNTSPNAEKQWFAVWSPVAAAGAGSIATIAGALLYSRFFRRIPTAEAVRPSIIARKAWIKGTVTRCVMWVYPFQTCLILMVASNLV